MMVLWLDPAAAAAALDPESEVKDNVFPPKENPVVSAENPLIPVVKAEVDAGGASEPRLIDFPAKENPPPVVVKFVVRDGADGADGSHLHSVRRLIMEGQQGAYQWRCANQ